MNIAHTSHHDHHDHAHDDHHGHDDGHSHAPAAAHDHGAHGHHHHGNASERRLIIALAITVAFMLVEAIGGWIAGSLALLADALHMLTDGASLLLAIFALRVGRRAANERYSYGHQRYEVLAAFVNGLALLVLSGGVLFAAMQRLITPSPVDAHLMLITAALGLLANIVGFLVLRDGDDSLNMRAALLHVLSDLVGSAATIAAAIVILYTAWTPIDPLLSMLAAALFVRGGWRIARQSSHILLEGAPVDLDVREVERELVAQAIGVDSVHHVHAWSLTGQKPMMTLHAVLNEQADRTLALGAIQQLLLGRFGVEHATVQLEQNPCEDVADHHSKCA